MGYEFKLIDKKWQEAWKNSNAFYCDVYDFSKPKYYVLDMFPYPSGQGLHVGHTEGYTATDIIARMKRMQGYNVLHPIGWDAFGLPAEQYAIKTGNHPEIFTNKNIANFKRQLNDAGFSYDWSKEISTTDPSYFKWTQWFFLNLYSMGLAYVDYKPVNYCPELGTVLANEEVVDGKSEVGGFDVIRKPMRQWVLRITSYADRLLDDLDGLNWPTSTLEMQRNWIGRSLGAEVIFKVKGTSDTFSVFTTRVDTLFGCTYCCLAPEHPLVDKIVSSEQKPAVSRYIAEIASKSDLERTELNKDKTGVFLGAYAINPINNEEVPIYIADYILASYGSGAVMAVPAHDDRDYAFAKKHGLNIKKVLDSDITENAFTGDAKHINSSFADGLNINDAKAKIIEYLEAHHTGKSKTMYKLRDWLFSRQRYWGEPIPIVFLDNQEIYPLPFKELPLLLPHLDEYKPSGTGESPLANAKEWLQYDVKGIKGIRETNTMPQWAGSCWYYIRYLDPHNEKMIADPKLMAHWLPVDLYIGGAEHAVLHLLYARFWHKTLYDLHIVDCKEPFKRLFHQGIILGTNGEKMSKSRGNVVNPDDVIAQYGADSLRFYEMFMGPLEASLPWSSSGLDGTKRYLDRVARLIQDSSLRSKIVNENDGKLDYVYNYTVKKVTNDYESLQINTALAQLMILTNEFYRVDKIFIDYVEGFIKLLYPVAPHLCEELWSELGHNEMLVRASWPAYDEEKTKKDTVSLGVQVNGKLRATITVSVDASEEEVKKIAFEEETIKRHTEGKEIKKVIVVKNKIVNIVAI